MFWFQKGKRVRMSARHHDAIQARIKRLDASKTDSDSTKSENKIEEKSDTDFIKKVEAMKSKTFYSFASASNVTQLNASNLSVNYSFTCVTLAQAFTGKTLLDVRCPCLEAYLS